MASQKDDRDEDKGARADYERASPVTVRRADGTTLRLPAYSAAEQEAVRKKDRR